MKKDIVLFFTTERYAGVLSDLVDENDFVFVITNNKDKVLLPPEIGFVMLADIGDSFVKRFVMNNQALFGQCKLFFAVYTNEEEMIDRVDLLRKLGVHTVVYDGRKKQKASIVQEFLQYVKEL